MKKICSLLLLAGYLVPALGQVGQTSVLFPIQSMFGGAAYGKTITVTAVNTIVQDGYNLNAGTYWNIPSTGTNPIVPLYPNSYLLTIQGVANSVRFSVPASTNVLNLVTNGLITSGSVIYLSTNSFVNINPTNGVYFITNTDGSISIGSSGGTANALTNGAAAYFSSITGSGAAMNINVNAGTITAGGSTLNPSGFIGIASSVGVGGYSDVAGTLPLSTNILTKVSAAATYLPTNGNGSGLTGLTAAQIGGVITNYSANIYYVGTNAAQLANYSADASHKFTTLYDMTNNVRYGALTVAGPGSTIYVAPGFYTNAFLPCDYPNVKVIGLGMPTIQRGIICNGQAWTNFDWKTVPMVSANNNSYFEGINFVSIATPSNAPTTVSCAFIGANTPVNPTQPGWFGTNFAQILSFPQNYTISNEMFGIYSEFGFTNHLSTNVIFRYCIIDHSKTIDLNYFHAYHLDCFATNDSGQTTPLDFPAWGNMSVTYDTCSLLSGWDLTVNAGPEMSITYQNCSLNQTLFNTNSGTTGIFTASDGASLNDIGSKVIQRYSGGTQTAYGFFTLAGFGYQDGASYKPSITFTGTRFNTFGGSTNNYVNQIVANSISGTFVGTNNQPYATGNLNGTTANFNTLTINGAQTNNGSLQVTGTVTAASFSGAFSGNGAAVTNLNIAYKTNVVGGCVYTSSQNIGTASSPNYISIFGTFGAGNSALFSATFSPGTYVLAIKAVYPGIPVTTNIWFGFQTNSVTVGNSGVNVTGTADNVITNFYSAPFTINQYTDANVICTNTTGGIFPYVFSFSLFKIFQ